VGRRAYRPIPKGKSAKPPELAAGGLKPRVVSGYQWGRLPLVIPKYVGLSYLLVRDSNVKPDY
jgi:hypothetical protein